MAIIDLKALLKEGKLIFGSARTIKLLKLGRIKKVFIADNCREDVKRKLEYYSKLSGVDLVKLGKSREEFSIICEKPFLISVVASL